MATKTCIACGRTWNISQFYLDRTQPDGHVPRCIECVKACKTSYSRPAEDSIGNPRPYAVKATPTERGTQLIRMGDLRRSSHAQQSASRPMAASPLAWGDA